MKPSLWNRLETWNIETGNRYRTSFKHYALLSLFLLWFSPFTLGQEPDLTPYKSTPDKIAYLQKQISQLGRNGKFVQVIDYARHGVLLAQKAKIDSSTAQFYYFIASAYSAQSKTDSTLYYFHKAAQIAPKNSTILLRTWIQLIYTYNLMGKQDSAYATLNLAKKAAQRTKSRKIQGDLEILDANLLVDNGSLTQALRAYIQAYTYYQVTKDSSDMAAALEGVSLVEQYLGNYSKSLKYIQEARALFLLLQNPDRVVNCELTIGDLYMSLNKIDSAQLYYKKAIAAGKQLEDDYVVGKAFRGLSEISDKMGDTRQAENYLQEALKIIMKTNIKPTIGGIQKALGEFYSKHKRYNDAKLYLEQALKNQQESERSSETIDTYLLLAQAEAALKQYDKAYYYHDIYTAQKDSLEKGQNAKVLAEVESRYQIDRKQQEIALLNEKNRSQSLEPAVQRRNVFLLISGLFMSGVFGTVGYRRYRLRKRLEMEQIRNRIAADFHDELGANLSSIALYSDLLLKNTAAEKEKALPILENISQQAHGSISSINDLIWTIKPDNDVLERTIVRMKEFANPLLEARNIGFVFEVDDSLPQAHLSMNMRKFMYLIFKEAINNAAKYSRASKVRVYLQERKGMIRMEICDDGVGFDADTVARGNGLNNMQTRARELNGSLVIDSQPGKGTWVICSFKALS